MRWIHYVNFVGIVALAVLIIVQSKRNSQLNLMLIDLQKTRIEQDRKIADDARTIKNISADLEDFRGRLQLAEDQEKQDEAQIKKLGGELKTAIAAQKAAITECDQAKKALAEWEEAVKQRDELIKKASEDITKLGTDREQAVAKFNDLAMKYNALVKDLNDARAKAAQSK